MTLRVDHLHLRYGSRIALQDVSLTASPGEVLVLVGPNGSGKSSLLKAVAGLLPYRGTVVLPVHRPRQRAIGYMPQDSASQAALTVLETVMLGRLDRLGLRITPQDLTAAHSALGQLGVTHLADRHLTELSGGQRQLVFLAQVLAADVSVMLLDEPISALDIHHQLHVLDTVRRLTRDHALTTIIVLHDLNAALRHADRLAVMKDGALVVLGTPAEVVTHDVVNSVFGVEADIREGPDSRPIVTALRRVMPSV